MEIGSKRRAGDDEDEDDNKSNTKRKFTAARSKNWSDLPAEIKLECIKWMNFMTRWALRRTAHSEKQLVESTKCDRDLLIVKEADGEIVTVFSRRFALYFKFREENVALWESLLRIGKFSHIEVDCRSTSFRHLRAISSRTPLHIQHLSLNKASRDCLEILNDCRGLERLKIWASMEDNFGPLDLWRDHHQLIANMKSLTLLIMITTSEDVIQCIEKWISGNKELRSKIVLKSGNRSPTIAKDVRNAFGGRFKGMTHVFDVRTLYISFGEDKYIEVNIHGIFEISLEVVDSCPF